MREGRKENLKIKNKKSESNRFENLGIWQSHKEDSEATSSQSVAEPSRTEVLSFSEGEGSSRKQQ